MTTIQPRVDDTFLDRLEIGLIPKYTRIKVRVKSLRVSDPGKKYYGYGTLEDPTGSIKVTFWEKPPFEEGDTVMLTDLYEIGEYNGQRELKLGRYYKVTREKGST